MKIPITQFFGARRPLIICLWFAGFVFKTIGGDHREKPRSSIILIDQQYLDSFTLTFSNFGLEQVAIGQLSHMTKRERKFLSILAGTRPLDGFLQSYNSLPQHCRSLRPVGLVLLLFRRIHRMQLHESTWVLQLGFFGSICPQKLKPKRQY